MSYIGSKRSSSLVSFDEGTIGSGVVFPAGMVIGSAITFFNQITSYTMQAGAAEGDYGLNTGIDIDDLTVTYTPLSTSNKLFVSGVMNFGVTGDTTGKAYCGVRVKRQVNGGGYSMLTAAMNTDTAAMPGTSSRIGIAGYSNRYAASNSTQYGHTSFNLHFGFTDSSHVSTVGHTVNYKINHVLKSNDSGVKTLYLNRNGYNTNDYGSHTMVSYIRIEEISNG